MALLSSSPANEWADFWRYNIGVNVIPADTQKKRPIIPWEQWQDKPIPQELHNEWKEKNTFSKGIAIIPGKIWHRGEDKSNLYFTFLDADKQKAIDELCTRNGKLTTLAEISQKFIVEQHKDNLEKAHIYFYSPIPFPKKSADSVLGLEVKGLGEHGIAYCTCSLHRDGQPYEIIGTKEPITLTEEQAKEYKEHIDNICKKHGLEYLDKYYRNLIDSDTKIYQGSRHDSMLSIANSILFRYGDDGNHELLKNRFLDINDKRCVPSPLPTTEINQIWNDAVSYYTREKSKQRNFDSSSGELVSVSTAIRRSHGKVIVKGMIIGISPVVQVVTQTKLKCSSCQYSNDVIHNPPLFSLPFHLSLNRNRKCDSCNESGTYGPDSYTERSAMTIQLQDEEKQNDLESLNVVLFDNDTLDVMNGEKVIVKGDLHVVQQKGSNGKRITYLFAEDNGGIQNEKSQNEDIVLTEEDILKLNEYSKQSDYVEKVRDMFAPTVIGHENEKLGVILMYIGAPENEDFRGRIHGLFIGPPGNNIH